MPKKIKFSEGELVWGDEQKKMIDKLCKLVRAYSKNQVTSKCLDESIKHHHTRIEQKFLETKNSLLKWFVSISIIQTFVIISMLLLWWTFF
ncbi:hypothetical protein [Candidatus Bandiella euplotis]|uniref:Uncharacterized protein n=1 Tax=Candidatus Bandiella euplotis TaxID=1664265 RepID=A0ABZ0UJ18_9RICK|nr:hypothetical protein [Candidatus Bandiella woodruffii]WPX96085.1 hypothetical protein Bandiella_00188 [Candidatus Bandiella woodruffii]